MPGVLVAGNDGLGAICAIVDSQVHVDNAVGTVHVFESCGLHTSLGKLDTVPGVRQLIVADGVEGVGLTIHVDNQSEVDSAVATVNIGTGRDRLVHNTSFEHIVHEVVGQVVLVDGLNDDLAVAVVDGEVQGLNQDTAFGVFGFDGVGVRGGVGHTVPFVAIASGNLNGFGVVLGGHEGSLEVHILSHGESVVGFFADGLAVHLPIHEVVAGGGRSHECHSGAFLDSLLGNTGNGTHDGVVGDGHSVGVNRGTFLGEVGHDVHVVVHRDGERVLSVAVVVDSPVAEHIAFSSGGGESQGLAVGNRHGRYDGLAINTVDCTTVGRHSGDSDGVGLRSLASAEAYAVLHGQNAAGVAARCDGIVVGAVAVDTDGLVRCIEHCEGRVVVVVSSVVVKGKDYVAYAIVVERCVEGDGAPFAGGEGHFTTEHLVALGKGNPVGAVGKGALVGVNHVDIDGTSTFGGAHVLHVDARDGGGSAKFLGGVDLLGQAVVKVAVDRQVVVGSGAGTDADHVLRALLVGVDRELNLVGAQILGADGLHDEGVRGVGSQIFDGVGQLAVGDAFSNGGGVACGY